MWGRPSSRRRASGELPTVWWRPSSERKASNRYSCSSSLAAASSPRTGGSSSPAPCSCRRCCWCLSPHQAKQSTSRTTSTQRAACPTLPLLVPDLRLISVQTGCYMEAMEGMVSCVLYVALKHPILLCLVVLWLLIDKLNLIACVPTCLVLYSCVRLLIGTGSTPIFLLGTLVGYDAACMVGSLFRTLVMFYSYLTDRIEIHV